MEFNYRIVQSTDEAAEPFILENASSEEKPTIPSISHVKQENCKESIYKTFRKILSSPILRVIKDVLLVLLALWGLYNIIHNIIISTRPTPARKHCYCGNSTSEALTLGCKFDSLAAAWLPPHCRDEELTAEFEKSGDGPNGTWTYYADDWHTIPMSIEEVAALANNQSARVLMTRQWHVVHCIFYWRKQFRVRWREAQGGIVEPSFDSEEHIKHCGIVFLEDSWGTEARIALDS